MEKEINIPIQDDTNWTTLGVEQSIGCTVANTTMPNIFQINNPADNMLVTIKPDGQVEYGEGYTPDEAAKIFWQAVGWFSPQCQAQRDLVEANNKVSEHKREIRALQQRVIDLELMMWGPHGS